MAGVPQGFRDLIEKRYYNGPESFTSAKTVWQAIRDDATIIPKPTLKQVYAVIRAQSVTQTMTPLNIDRSTYDSITAKYRQPGDRRHQIQFDIVVWSMQKIHNKIGAAVFQYGFLFEDVFSRHAMLWPATNKNADTVLSMFKKAYHYYGGFENATLDGESGVNSNLVKAWAKQYDIRLWINKKPERGPSNTYMVERLIRTIRSRLAKLWRVTGKRSWAIPTDQATNPATADQIRNNQRPDTPIMRIIDNYNATKHSALGATPNDVFFNDVTPLYIKNVAKHGVCTEGPKCTPGAKKGIRKRDTSNLGYKPGLIGRIIKRLRALGDKKTDSKVLTAGLWKIIHVLPPDSDANYATGRANFDQGFDAFNAKVGESRRFLVEKVGDSSQRKVVLYWEFVPIDVENTRVFNPVTGKAQDLKLTGSKAEMGRLGQRFTQTDRATKAAERALNAEDLLSDDEVVDINAPRALRASNRPQPAAPLSSRKPVDFSNNPWSLGDRVIVDFPREGESYAGEVTKLNAKSVVVLFDVDGLSSTIPQSKYRLISQGQ